MQDMYLEVKGIIKIKYTLSLTEFYINTTGKT